MGGPRTNLVRERTPFIGRADDLAAVRRAFEQGGRLVTITGPAGSGKTRLARRYAAELLGSDAAPRGGAWVCDLGIACGEAGFQAAIATALELRFDADADSEPPDARIARALAARGPILLLVDNA